jgi:probable rRNA maturation factor
VSELIIRNRQRTRALNVPLLRRITRHVLEKEMNVGDYELGVHFVSANAMARVNEKFLEHEGSTDVITFSHNEEAQAERLHGEMFISMAWQSEVTRYLIHGLLHLRGYDDLQPAKRRVMKRKENRLLHRVDSQFALNAIARRRNS